MFLPEHLAWTLLLLELSANVYRKNNLEDEEYSMDLGLELELGLEDS